MIITENINSPLSIDDKNLDWKIDWGLKSIEGAGRIEITVDFWNLIDGEKMNQNQRNLYIITGPVDPSVGFSLNILKQFFYNFHPDLFKE